jgi:hypothetical protein
MRALKSLAEYVTGGHMAKGDGLTVSEKVVLGQENRKTLCYIVTKPVNGRSSP